MNGGVSTMELWRFEFFGTKLHGAQLMMDVGEKVFRECSRSFELFGLLFTLQLMPLF